MRGGRAYSDGGAEETVDAVDVAVGHGPVAVPRVEDGVDGILELHLGGGRELLAGLRSKGAMFRQYVFLPAPASPAS